MEYESIEELIKELKSKNKKDATKELTRFYLKIRFGISNNQFKKFYVDGTNDGGIDFYFKEDDTFFIFQTKFISNVKNLSESDIYREVRKIINNIEDNINKKAKDFVAELTSNLNSSDKTLEIIFLTTGIARQRIIEEIRERIKKQKRKKGWTINIDFIVIDKNALDNVVYDFKHGYIPRIGKKTLKLNEDLFFEMYDEETGVKCITAMVNVNDILKWFKNGEEVEKALNKNVREFLGENQINKNIMKSYNSTPQWFWHKHNGIIIFADSLSVDRDKHNLVIRNPQIVNGGQTIKSIFPAYLKNGKRDNEAKILIRIYHLPYERVDTYKRSIEIISALNSQSKILPSDLRSTDPRQVKLERLFNKLEFDYYRKRSKNNKSSKYGITMRNLAKLYHICKREAPNEGVVGKVEDLFEDDKKYESIFNENEINKRLGNSHICLKYITCWTTYANLIKIKKKLPKIDQEYFKYTKFFVLVDMYIKLLHWKQTKFEYGWEEWVKFLNSHEFERFTFEYGEINFKIGRKIIPKTEEPRAFFKTTESNKKFFSKTSIRKFNNLINKHFKKFEKRMDSD